LEYGSGKTSPSFVNGVIHGAEMGAQEVATRLHEILMEQRQGQTAAIALVEMLSRPEAFRRWDADPVLKDLIRSLGRTRNDKRAFALEAAREAREIELHAEVMADWGFPQYARLLRADEETISSIATEGRSLLRMWAARVQ
jgi:hypothetical protein